MHVSLIGEDKLPDDLSWSPGMDDIRPLSIRKEPWLRKELIESCRYEKWIKYHLQCVFALWDGHDTCVTGRAHPVRKPADMIQAVCCEIAVVDEEDVHAAE